MLERPAVVDEVRCQPVQQFGVGWRKPLWPEIVNGCHNSPSKKMMPDPIDNHSCGQWVVNRCDTFGKLKSCGGFTIEGLEEPCGHNFTKIVMASTDVDMSIFPRTFCHSDHETRRWQLAGNLSQLLYASGCRGTPLTQLQDLIAVQDIQQSIGFSSSQITRALSVHLVQEFSIELRRTRFSFPGRPPIGKNDLVDRNRSLTRINELKVSFVSFVFPQVTRKTLPLPFPLGIRCFVVQKSAPEQQSIELRHLEIVDNDSCLRIWRCFHQDMDSVRRNLKGR